jgi:hypothetical protein
VLVNRSLKFAVGSPVSTGNAFADLLMGQITSYSQGSQNIKFYNRYEIFEPYFQDDWRATERLTISLGPRISMFGTYREKYHHAYNWDPATYNPAAAPVIDRRELSMEAFREPSSRIRAISMTGWCNAAWARSRPGTSASPIL